MNYKKIGIIGVAMLVIVVVAFVFLQGSISSPGSAGNESSAIQRLDEPRQVPADGKVLNETHDQIIKDLQVSPIIDDKEKESLITQLNEIWSGKSSLSESEKNTILYRASSILLDTYSQSPSPQWVGCYYPGCSAAHNDMARVAGEKMLIDSYYSNILFQYASEPDRSGSADHYAITGAPQKAEDWANTARPLIISGSNPAEGYQDLAYSMHFMSDMSEPFHYAVVYLANHAAYESYVDANWNTGKTYVNAINGNTYYYYISDVSDSADNLAAFALQYRQYIQNEMDTVSNWEDDPTLIQDTNDCLVYGERYDMGLVNYVTRP